MNEWRTIDGISGYEFSFEGREAKCWGHKSGRQLSNKPSKHAGRINWNLQIEGKQYCRQAAVWIALAFPELVQNDYFEGAEIDHIDTDRLNNNPSNLRWVDRKGQMNNPLTLKHLSDGQKGEKSHMWGKVLSSETKKKISEALKGHTTSEDTRKLISERKTNHPKTSKKVAQYTVDGEYVKEYPSTKEAWRITGIDGAHIAACCRGTFGYKTAGGYKWSYVE